MLETSRPYIAAVARKFVRTDHDLEDVVQEVMLQAYRYRDGFRGASAYKSWLYRITVNVALNYVKRGRRHLAEVTGTVDGESTLVDQQASTEDLGGDAAARDLIADARRVVDALGDKYAMFWSHVELGMTEPELARAYGVTVATVKARVFRARRAVRAVLGQEFAA